MDHLPTTQEGPSARAFRFRNTTNMPQKRYANFNVAYRMWTSHSWLGSSPSLTPRKQVTAGSRPNDLPCPGLFKVLSPLSLTHMVWIVCAFWPICGQAYPDGSIIALCDIVLDPVELVLLQKLEFRYKTWFSKGVDFRCCRCFPLFDMWNPYANSQRSRHRIEPMLPSKHSLLLSLANPNSNGGQGHAWLILWCTWRAKHPGMHCREAHTVRMAICKDYTRDGRIHPISDSCTIRQF